MSTPSPRPIDLAPAAPPAAGLRVGAPAHPTLGVDSRRGRRRGRRLSSLERVRRGPRHVDDRQGRARPDRATVTATGTVNPVKTVQVGTYVSGPIQAIDVDFNSPVTKGQRVAKIDPRPFELRVQQSQAQLANARAALDKARADLEYKSANLDRNRKLPRAGDRRRRRPRRAARAASSRPSRGRACRRRRCSRPRRSSRRRASTSATPTSSRRSTASWCRAASTSARRSRRASRRRRCS